MAAGGACAAPSADYGQDLVTVNVPAAASYRVWAHMLGPSASANTFMLQVDGTQCFTIKSSAAAGSWGWTDSDSTGLVVELPNLSMGSHSLTLIGAAPGVLIDSMFLTSDTSCAPTGDGSNCGSQVSVGVSPSMSPGSTSSTGSTSNTTVAAAQKKTNSALYLTIGIALIVAGLGVLTFVWIKMHKGVVNKQW